MSVSTRPLDPSACADLVASARWAAKVAPQGDCIVWIGAARSNGYGTVNLGGVTVSTHRVSYVASNGDIPAGLQIDHLCRNRACVKPEHLEAVTAYENVHRTNGPVPALADRVKCSRGHDLVGPDADLLTTGIRRGTRTCRKCINMRNATLSKAIRDAAQSLGLTYTEYVKEHGRGLHVALSFIGKEDAA